MIQNAVIRNLELPNYPIQSKHNGWGRGSLSFIHTDMVNLDGSLEPTLAFWNEERFGPYRFCNTTQREVSVNEKLDKTCSSGTRLLSVVTSRLPEKHWRFCAVCLRKLTAAKRSLRKSSEKSPPDVTQSSDESTSCVIILCYVPGCDWLKPTEAN